VDPSGGKEAAKGNAMKPLFFLTVVLWFVLPLAAQTPGKPAWAIRKPQDTAEMSYFTSVVDEFASEEEALRSAVNNVNNAAANSTIVYIRSSVSERSRNTENQAAFTINIETDSYTDVILSGINIETYSERYINQRNQQRYRAWALAAVSKAQTEENRRAYLDMIAKRYTLDPAIRGDNLSGALSAYNGVYQALLENPLHRTIALYEDGQSLFEYCRLRITEIADSLVFDDIPPQAVQQGGALAVQAGVSSPLFAKAGALACTVTIESGNRTLPGGVWTVGGDNSFLLRLPVSALEAGNYRVSLELGISALSPAVTRNPGISFPLEVRPASAEIGFAGETLTGVEQGALSRAVQQALQSHRVPLLAGYEFLVTFTTQTRREPITGTSLLICEVSLSLNSGGSLLFQSASKRITEISRDHAITLAANYIRENKDFWTGAAEYMRR
jgi:hypothetical protein